MEIRTDTYATMITTVLDEIAQYHPSHGQIETMRIYDKVRRHYPVLSIGWDGTRRVHIANLNEL